MNVEVKIGKSEMKHDWWEINSKQNLNSFTKKIRSAFSHIDLCGFKLFPLMLTTANFRSTTKVACNATDFFFHLNCIANK